MRAELSVIRLMDGRRSNSVSTPTLAVSSVAASGALSISLQPRSH